MRVYLCVALIGVVFFVYWAGVHIGNAKCQTETAVAQSCVQSEIFKKVGDINEQVVSHGLGDIRRVLREKYTIAE